MGRSLKSRKKTSRSVLVDRSRSGGAGGSPVHQATGVHGANIREV